MSRCSPSGTPPKTANSPFAYIQIVDADGGRCVESSSQPVKIQPSDLDVARGTKASSLHNSTTEDGAPVRVHTTQARIGPARIAVSISRPLGEIDASLNRLALLLTAVAGAGVIGAGAAGLWIARTGLRPVDGLTRAVEHVARTEDLSLRIPAEERTRSPVSPAPSTP